jgi:EAL domain-containing protein (putative c-di-GMP-specific phosphodiesterase class I)
MLPQLQKLRDMGVQITIDDFVGDVGLSALSQMPVGGVKIGRQLVKKMSDPMELIALQRMITVATALGLNVVGQGVETNVERDFLAKAKSQQAQGFLLGRPVPAHEIAISFPTNIKSAGSNSPKKKPGK